MEGGVKTVKRSKNLFKMSDMGNALKALMGDTTMDTDVKKSRKTSIQPRRAPSARVQTIAKKTLEKKPATVVASALAQKRKKMPPKPKRGAPLSTLREESMPPRYPQLIPFDDDTIIKRNFTQDIYYGKKQDYLEDFNELFNKHIPALKESIRNDAMSEGQALTKEEVAINIVQLTDDLYFGIRDKLIGNIRSKSF